MSPLISVIIPHYSDLDALDVCLSKLSEQTLSLSDFEIIVADNNSPEGEAVVASRIAGRARMVTVTERGAGPARNGAAALASGPVLAFIDSDCVAEPDWLAEGLKALERYDFVGGRVKVLVSDPAHMTPAEAFERVFAFDFKSYIEKKGFSGSGNLFCPRSLFEAVGGFSVGVSEDYEWSHRATSAGYRLGYAPAAVVGHPARRTWQDLLAKWRRVNAETFGIYAARAGGRIHWLLRSLALPASAVVHTPKVLFSKELNQPAQRLAAIGILFRLRFWRLADSVRLAAAFRGGS